MGIIGSNNHLEVFGTSSGTPTGLSGVIILLFGGPKAKDNQTVLRGAAPKDSLIQFEKNCRQH